MEFVAEMIDKKEKRKPKELSLDRIQKVVAEHFKISPDSVKSKSKTYEVATARQIAMYIARHYTIYSLKTIGEFFGGRDHSTVIHSINKISDSFNHDSLLKCKVDEIIKKLQTD